MIILDTNVLSELMKREPSTAVYEWISGVGELYTTSLTLAEIFYGIERLPEGKRKLAMRTSATDVMGGFEGRVLPFDTRAASVYPILVCERERRGLPLQGLDAQIAAICRSRDASLATRNVKDFVHTGVPLIDPWAG
jgi:predicted nucleic acid-binding protein